LSFAERLSHYLLGTPPYVYENYSDELIAQWERDAHDDLAVPAGLYAGVSASVSNSIAKGLTGRVATEAQLFRNLAPAEAIGAAVLFPASQIQKVAYSGTLNYVVTASGNLIVRRTGRTSLAGGAAVLAAGEARFVNGALRSVNNASGHYRPSGASARSAAEAAFGRAGFDASGKYVEGGF
jgi:hypothetical protein